VKKKIFIIINNHFDLTWRRRFRGRLVSEGRSFVSYADLQEYYIADNLELCEKYPFYQFQIESPAVVREYLSRHPEKKQVLQALIDEKRLWISATGDNIVDGNLPGGESIVRNFMIGQRWLRETFGFAPRLANRDDAFGNCAQLPQILRGCGLRWVKGLSYTACPKEYWRGLDGSIVYTRQLPVSGMGGGWRKYAPCSACKGNGATEDGSVCDCCSGRGIDRAKNELDRQPITLQENPPEQGVVMVGGEEILPHESVVQWYLALDRREYDVCFASEEDQYDLLKDKIEEDRPTPEDVFEGELNPNNTGCAVTRIQTKQQARQIENLLLQLETICVMASLKGKRYPKDEMDALWRGFLFTVFHDAVTATHVDAAYAELLETWAALHQRIGALRLEALPPLVMNEDRRYSVLNHLNIPYTGTVTLLLEEEDAGLTIADDHGNPISPLRDERLPDGRRSVTVFVRDIEPFHSKTFRLQAESGPQLRPWEEIITPLGSRGIQSGILRADESGPGGSAGNYEQKLENARYRVRVGNNGILDVYDKTARHTVAGYDGAPALTFYLENDTGSPWATVLPGQERMDLLPYSRLHKIEYGESFSRAVYIVEPPQTIFGSINGIRLQYAVTLCDGADQIDISVWADWDAYSTRLRFCVNTPITGRHLYEVPYGVLERKPYVPIFSWTGANGDWPTQNFAGISAGVSVCLMNRGLAAYSVEERAGHSKILVSLLRSPTMPTYLHEPDAYSMLEFDGMRDTGTHKFSLALTSYHEPLELSGAVLDAQRFNTELACIKGTSYCPKMPVVYSSCARLSAVKQSEDRDGFLYRIIEFKGEGGTVEIILPGNINSAEQVNLLEDHLETVAIVDRRVSLHIKPFEIISLRFDLVK